MRVADVMARKLAAAGATRAFGIPGGEVLTIIDALRAAGIAFHLTKHENFAGFLAEGVWHATGAPGILVATIGPGVANAVNVIANAEQDRVPLIVITGCLDGADADTYTHQVFDHQKVLAPITKASFRVNAKSADQVMDKALAIALSGQPGPVHLDLPIAVAEAEADAPLGLAPAAGPTLPGGAALDEARALVAAAERPIIVAGVDAVNEGAADALRRFVDATGAPLITTYKGKGLIDEDDPLSLGAAGLSPLADRQLLPLLKQSDCIVLAGYDPIEMRIGWRDPWPADAGVIDITPVLRTHGMHRVAVTLNAGIAATLDALTEAARGGAWPGGEPATVRAMLREAFAPEAEGWGPATVFHALREVAPKNTVITADSGAHRILLSQAWRCHGPRQMLQSSALCTMGCAVALAAGRALAAPGTPAMAFVGDAGLEMTLGDLATVRDLLRETGGALPIVVLIDESLALIEMKQRGMQFPNTGVDFTGTDFPTLARAMGGYGVWIDDAPTLRAEAEAALERPGFTLLCARIGRRAYDGKL